MVLTKLSNIRSSAYLLFEEVYEVERKHKIPCILARATLSFGITYIGFSLVSAGNPLIAATFSVTYILICQIAKHIFYHFTLSPNPSNLKLIRDALFITSFSSLVFFTGKLTLKNQPLNFSFVWVTSMIGSKSVPLSILIMNKMKRPTPA